MTGLIILAAGNSSRLGRPKQNLVYQNQTLLQRAIATAISSDCEPIILVLGANAEVIEVPPHKKLTIVYNEAWQEGMASSIRAGITELEKSALVHQAIIMLCDQPFVTAALLNALINFQLETQRPIVASFYKNVPGVPALFNKSLFPDLKKLRGQHGAKQLLSNHSADVATVQFDKGIVDIDNPEDFERLIKTGN
jgi:molybdenum cofactor cytidylyltransferase